MNGLYVAQFVPILFWAYVTINGDCNYQQIGFASNNHNSVIVVTQGLNVHLKTVKPGYNHSVMEDLNADSTVYYELESHYNKDGEFVMFISELAPNGSFKGYPKRKKFSVVSKYMISTSPCSCTLDSNQPK